MFKNRGKCKIIGLFLTALAFSLFILNYCTHCGGIANAASYSNIKKYSFKNRFLIHKLDIKSGVIYKLNTALGYVSVVTLPTIPLDVAMGNTGAFSEQVVGRRIFIKPITYDTGTTSNLEIFTKYGLINILLRIKSSRLVTYNLNLANTLKNVFASNYIESKIDKLKTALLQKYKSKFAILNEKQIKLIKERKEVMNLILLVNRLKINKISRKFGLTLTVISISHIKSIYYLEYQITNNNNKPFFIRNIYLYEGEGGSFFNGYNPNVFKEIYIINHTPHNTEYMPYKIVRNVIIFKKSKIGAGYNLKLSIHTLVNGKLVRLRIDNILNN
ncbi:MAG: TrbG/VirB9 family P-type conjugative transfer protein [Deltaproteobacteria bacterium]|jgi:hypothetical protein|nr:TrbG/VirB9 family P-type conjugative transfer protein [Deltaproteobacteria bacterium]MCL5880582.1 TrbG/VirB9 family P-type conjugative transfer protein [Deltaproteobacteria bacterium]